MFRPHPLYCFYDSKKWILLLLLPVLRVVFSPRDAASVLMASLRDVLLAFLLIGYSVAKWRRARYSLHDGLTLRQGLLYRRTLRISADDAASVEVERTPLMWITGGRRVRVNTAGLRRRADATLYLPAAAARQCVLNGSGRQRRRYTARVLPVAVMAASSSNAALGLLTLAPAVRQAGQILGREMTGEVYNLMDRLLSLGLPPLFNALTNILVLGWGFAFIRIFARTAGFYAGRDGERLHVTAGLLTRRDVYIDCGRITALELRQNIGQGVEKGRIPCCRNIRPAPAPSARRAPLCGGMYGPRFCLPPAAFFLSPSAAYGPCWPPSGFLPAAGGSPSGWQAISAPASGWDGAR